jgi:dTDP-4-dehydrorhamnose reductase
MTRILVTGASGLLGLNLALDAGGAHTVTGVDRSKLRGVPFPLFHADLLDPGALQRVLDESQPEAVIHCAALANVDACEANPALARRLNTDLPAELAAACARRSMLFLHISTDAVFDGCKDGYYTERDIPNPSGVYAHTKLDGETAVLTANSRAIIARVNFFGWSLGGKRSLAEFFFNNLIAGRRCGGFTDVWFCPMFVGDLAKVLVRMMEKGLSGLYHVVGAQVLTKYEFGVRIARQFGFDPELIVPASVEESGLKAKRSHNLRLSVQKLSTDLGVDIPSVPTGIERFYIQYQRGYPQELRTYQQLEGSEL